MPIGATGLILPDMMGAFNAGADRGRENLQRSTLAKYAQPALGGDQGALAKIYGVDPDAGIKIQHLGQQQQQDAVTAKDEGMARVGKYARMITTMADTGDMQAAAGLYKTIYPEVAKVLGPNLPPDLDPSMLPHMKQIADSMAPQQKSDLINVGAGGAVFDPKTQKPIYTNPGVEKPAQIVTVNRPDGTTQQFQNTPQGLVPLQVAPQGQAPQAGAQDPMNAIIQRANALAQAGVPDDQVRQFIQQQAQSAGVQMGPPGQMGRPDTGAAPLPPELTTPQLAPNMQLGRSAPKQSNTPDAFRPATPDELKKYRLPDSAVAQINTKTGKMDVISKPPALSPDKLADVAVKRQKVEQAKQESVAAFNDSITKIDSLLKDPAFSALGTFVGDAAAKIPHTNTANAKAQLDTISAQSVINVLSSLKSLSSNGSSGFGALSEKEGEILRNAAANLSTSQGNAAIRKNLLELKQKLARSRDRVSAQAIQLPEDSVAGPAGAPAPATTNDNDPLGLLK